jgi:hypothetical protein
MDVMYNSNDKFFNVAIYNEGDEDIIINEHEEIFEAETLNSQYVNINKLQLSDTLDILPVSFVNVFEKIEKDKGLQGSNSTKRANH